MSDEQPAGAAPLRFNPFAFVTDSTFRFALLILAVVGSALYLTSPWGFALLPQARAADASLSCLGPALQPRTPAPIGGIADIADRLSEPDRRITGTPCSDALLRRLPGYRGLAMVVVGFAVGILLAALAIYWLTPPWLIRRRRLVPVPAAEMPDLAASLAGLCDEVGVR